MNDCSSHYDPALYEDPDMVAECDYQTMKAQKEYEDWLANPAKSANEPSQYNSSNGTDIHGDYYTYETDSDREPAEWKHKC
ncbi:hypothetical protein PVAP13_9KG237865 [Panicum virgatum]|uniref:Uncharacterized protein n=1 Tax=Panicum virgatum TaxID=38727 RepID=A0A8T0NL99_PANVG|nr:hypothetical protein PVAP13_9KG237865 [Panicum virgatum]